MDFYLQRASAAIESVTAGMTLAQLTAHPEGKWSSAEILEHLSLTFSSTVKGLQRVADSGKAAGSQPTLRNHLVNLLVIEIGFFPKGRNAPEFTVPRGVPAESIIATLRDHLARMDAVITDCERRFGAAARIADHPVLGPFTARQWRKFHLVHTRHHMKQIAALRG